MPWRSIYYILILGFVFFFFLFFIFSFLLTNMNVLFDFLSLITLMDSSVFVVVCGMMNMVLVDYIMVNVIFVVNISGDYGLMHSLMVISSLLKDQLTCCSIWFHDFIFFSSTLFIFIFIARVLGCLFSPFNVMMLFVNDNNIILWRNWFHFYFFLILYNHCFFYLRSFFLLLSFVEKYILTDHHFLPSLSSWLAIPWVFNS